MVCTCRDVWSVSWPASSGVRCSGSGTRPRESTSSSSCQHPPPAHRLAQAHLVGQDAVEAVAPQRDEPLDALELRGGGGGEAGGRHGGGTAVSCWQQQQPQAAAGSGSGRERPSWARAQSNGSRLVVTQRALEAGAHLLWKSSERARGRQAGMRAVRECCQPPPAARQRSSRTQRATQRQQPRECCSSRPPAPGTCVSASMSIFAFLEPPAPAPRPRFLPPAFCSAAASACSWCRSSTVEICGGGRKGHRQAEVVEQAVQSTRSPAVEPALKAPTTSEPRHAT